MKKIIPWISWLAIILLAACSLPSSGGGNPPVVLSTETLSPAQIQTQISSMLTLMPTATGELAAAESSPTPGLPTVGVVTATVEGYPAPEKPTLTPSDDSQEQSPTATPDSQAAAPTATTAATPSPVPTLPQGGLGGDWDNATDIDHMDSSQNWNWPTGSDKFSRATFANGAQEIETLSDLDGWRMANPTGYGFSNITLEAVFKTGTACTENAHYGLMLRVPVLQEPDQGYLFGVTCDGRYSLRRWDGEVDPKGEMWDVIHNSKYFFEGSWIESTAINKGSNQVNRLRVDMNGSTFTLYANGTKLTDVQVNQARGSYFSSGHFGVFVGPGNMEKLRVQLDEMAYWQR